jgi:hypothetical protein
MTFGQLAEMIRALDDHVVDPTLPDGRAAVQGRWMRVVGIDGLSGVSSRASP